MPSFLGRGDGLGSNSWVVDGAHSTTGEPILANDPHLGVGMPGIWMQMGLHCRTVSDACPFDVSGFTFSGVPGVIIGHNADISWGFTNLGPDVTDLSVERVRGDEWFRDGEWQPLKTRTETIEVDGGDDETIEVRSTTHGPLLSDVGDDLQDVADEAAPGLQSDRSGVDSDEDYALALQWTALEPGRTADAIFDLNLASDWDEFRAAVSSFEVPAQNLVYADREGHIGYQAPGRIPIRKSGNDGRMPSAGWLPENDWTGDYVPFDGLPRILDPADGVIVTANQAVIGEDYPYFLTSDWDQGYRSERIRDLLESKDTWSVDDMTKLQLDDQNPMAAVLTPYLLDIDVRRQYYRDGQDLLRTWDFDQDADSGAAAYFNVVWRNLLEDTFQDELPKDLWPDGGDRWVAAVTGLLNDPRNGWWDDLGTDDVVEDRDDILHRALLRRPRRDDRTAGLGPRRVELGLPAPARPARADARRLRHRPGRVDVQPGWLGGRRRPRCRRCGQLGRVGRGTALRRHDRAVDADGRVARRLRRLALDQPDRGLGPSVQRALHRPDRPLGPRRDAAVAVHRGRRGRRRGALTRAGTVGSLTVSPPRSPGGRAARRARRGRPRRRGAARM